MLYFYLLCEYNVTHSFTRKGTPFRGIYTVSIYVTYPPCYPHKYVFCERTAYLYNYVSSLMLDGTTHIGGISTGKVHVLYTYKYSIIYKYNVDIILPRNVPFLA